MARSIRTAASRLLLLVLLLDGCSCGRRTRAAPRGNFTLPKLRASLRTKLKPLEAHEPDPPPKPPAGILELVTYPAPLGANAAYVSPIGPAGEKRPAIVWISGGMNWGIGESSWEAAERENDQSARAFREAGVILMRPSLRGANDNPGRREMFLGEVDDVIAAGQYLRRRPDVDPARLYLGGHSTGGTMALLVAESTDMFRAVFAFGAVAHVRNYGDDDWPFDPADAAETMPRSPIFFMSEIQTPTYVIDGAIHSNVAAEKALQKVAKSAPVQFVFVPGADHFSVLAPSTEVIARQILADRGSKPSFSIDPASLAAAMGSAPASSRKR